MMISCLAVQWLTFLLLNCLFLVSFEIGISNTISSNFRNVEKYLYLKKNLVTFTLVSNLLKPYIRGYQVMAYQG